MPTSRGSYQALLRECSETPPEISYRFVVSLDALRKATQATEIILRDAGGPVERALTLFLQFVLIASLAASIMWVGWYFSLLSERVWNAHPVLATVAGFHRGGLSDRIPRCSDYDRGWRPPVYKA
jgi:hypothetical protein